MVRLRSCLTTKVPRLQPVYASINKPLTIGGADRRLFFVALVVGGATFTLFGSLLTGLMMFPALYLAARLQRSRELTHCYSREVDHR